MRYFPLFLLALFSCSKSQEAPKEKLIPVQVTRLESKDSPIFLETQGVLAPISQAEVRLQVSGRISKILCEEGQNVQKGDLLASIDPTLYELRLQEAKSAFLQKKIQLESVEKKINRHLSLQKPHLAAIEFDALEQEASLLKAALAADVARVKQAELNVENCSLRAPISGKIGKIAFHEENWISENGSLCTVRNVDSLFVEFALTETEVLAFYKKSEILTAPLEVSSAQGERAIDGKFLSLDNRIDPRSGTIQAKGILENKDHSLWPGQHVSLRLLLGKETNQHFLPLETIQQNLEGKFVYVVGENQTAEMRPVSLGKVDGKEVAILSGLQLEDQIVIKGQMRLYPGAKVEIKP